MSQIKSDTITDGIRIEAQAQYIKQESKPEHNQFVFVYKIRISNEGDKWAKLDSRYWLIINAEGEEKEVKGPGVVGYYPALKPGEQFEYTSWSPLDTEWGTMEGRFEFHREDGERFSANINRFYLAMTAEETLENF